MFLVGEGGVMAIGDFAGGMTTYFGTTEQRRLSAVFGLSPTDVYLGGEVGAVYHFDGEKLTEMPGSPGVPIYGMWGSGDGGIWAVGRWGDIFFYDLKTKMWRGAPSPTGLDLRAIAGRVANEGIGKMSRV